MTRIKRLGCVLLILALLCGLLGCSGAAPQSAAGGATRQVTDCAGRTVTVPDSPQRVACLYAATAHMMAMLGVERTIVASPDGVRRDILMQYKYPEIANVSVPIQSGAINVEELAKLGADLALVNATTANTPAEVEKLDKLDIPYVVVDFLSVEELRVAIGVMGEVFALQDKADAFLTFFDETIRLANTRVSEVVQADKPLVYHAVNEASRTDAPGDICSEITDLAGVVNASVAAGIAAGGDKTYTTLEEIYKWAPDAILANEYTVTEYIRASNKWAGLAAVENAKVYTLPLGISRWCHHGSMEAHMGVLSIASTFYPEKFADVDMHQYTKDYYAQYFALELTDEDVDKILAGEGMRLGGSNASLE